RLQLLHRALHRGVGVPRRVRHARRAQAAGRAPGVAHAVAARRASGADVCSRAGRRRAGRHRPRAADDDPARRVGAGRRGCAVRRDDHRGADARRPAARPRGAAPPWARRLPDQPDGGGRGHRARRHRRGVAVGARRTGVDAGRPPGAPPAHRPAADRVRGGLVDRAGLDRGAAARPRGAGRGAVAGLGVRRVARRGPLRAGDALGGPGARPGRAARAAGERGRPEPRPRLPGPRDRARAARRALHEVGPLDHLPGRVMVTLAQRVGAAPAQLATLVACLALAAYAAFFLLGDPALLRMLVWFAAAAVVHDLVIFPLHAGADRLLTAVLPGPKVNYLRVPALGAGLALLMFWPGIVRQGEVTHLAATGLDQAPYLGRWLVLCAVLFGASAVVFGARVGLRRLRA